MRAQSTLLAIVVAVIAGLGIGGLLFYRIVNDNLTTSQARKQSNAATVPAVSSETTQTPLQPPAEADALATKTTDTVAASPRVSKRARKEEVVPIASVDTPPSLIQPASAPNSSAPVQAPVAAAPTAAPAAPVPQQPPAPAVNPTRRRAVQETEAESSPVPASPLANSAAPPVEPGAPTPTSRPEPASKRSYEGPMAGMATWTGKLEKNGTLTITGGTPSMGVLAGAGLPGVPVHLTIDQSNLGFVEMPSAANGYRKLVLKSHSNHDKITIHWSVVQQ